MISKILLKILSLLINNSKNNNQVMVLHIKVSIDTKNIKIKYLGF